VVKIQKPKTLTLTRKTDCEQPLVNIQCFTDLDIQIEMIIFALILITIELSSMFEGSWGSIENWLEPKTKPPLRNLAFPNP